MRVIVVDDNGEDQGLRASLATSLPGAEIVQIVDRAGLEQALSAGGIDVAITELHLGWSTGPDVLSAIRGRFPDVPVIMFTGEGTEEAAAAAMRAGFHDYVMKGSELLPDAVRSAVEVTQERRRASLDQAFLDSLLVAAPVGLCLLDLDLRYTHINETLAASNGQPVGAHIGRTVREMVPDLAPALESHVRTVFATGTPSREPLLVTGATPADPLTPHHWLNSYFPVRGRKGELVGVGAIVTDITERRRAEERIEQSRSLLEATLDSTADGILVVDAAGRITEANRRFAQMWSIPQEILESGDDDRALEQAVGQLVEPETFIDKVRELYSKPEEESFDILEFRDGRVFERYSIPQRLGGEVVGRVWSFRDVTERRRVESEYRMLVERLPAVVYVAEPGVGAPWHYVSPRIEEMLGFSTEEWQDDPELWYRQIHPDDVDRVMAEEIRYTEIMVPLVSEYRMFHRDGHVVWVRDEGEYREEHGGPSVIRGLMYDITARKEMEEALRSSEAERRQLLAHQVAAQEDERRRIAEDIHDDSIQAMAAVGIRLSTLSQQLSDEKEREQVARVERAVESAVTRLRHLMFQLRPRVLDEEGLGPTLRILLQQFGTDEGLDARLDDRTITEPPQETRAVLYRIIQEAIANGRKHAQGAAIEIVLEERERGYYARVRDHGPGFDIAGSSPAGHMGLSSMRERAEMAGGWWRLESSHEGTVVECWVPAGPTSPES